MSYLNNALTYLFKHIEENSNIEFASFNTMERASNNTKIPNSEQKYMQEYNNINNNTNKLYKYLYDPALAFDFRFHQRINSIKYNNRKEAWVSLVFNTREVRPLTNHLSLKYDSYEKINGDISKQYELKTKRVLVPIDIVFFSNDLQYLYTFLENISMFFDRLINFPYKQSIKYGDDIIVYDQVGQAFNIEPQDLTKLDTEMRGSLCTSAYSFNLVYYTHTLPKGVSVLQEIDVNIKVGSIEGLQLIIK